jgi:hypothetical protein
MNDKRELLRRWLLGTLDRLRENTKGGDPELLALMNKLNVGLFVWDGPPPCGTGRAKPRRR